MNLVLAGPVAVGKSTVGKRLARRAHMTYRDFDDEGRLDAARRQGEPSPFSLRYLDLSVAIPLILPAETEPFVLDFGGETVFRRAYDNDERLAQILWLMTTYSARIVALVASRDVLLGRHRTSRNGNVSDFEATWADWREISRPYWKKAGATFVDTSTLAPDEVVSELQRLVNTATLPLD